MSDRSADIAKDAATQPSLEAVLPVAELQALLDAFNVFFPAVTAILDREGRVLQASGWQDACTKFHRVNPQSCRNCTESDTWLAENVRPGEFVAYRCRNGLNDVVTPLHIEGAHVGNLYTGQFFYDDEPVDEARFEAQAQRYGWDRAGYLDAIRRVPRVSRRHVEAVMAFVVRLTSLLSGLGTANRALARDLAERQQLLDALEASQASQRQLEASMRQAQKLESLGLLAGGIAHDFNNLLAAIGSSVEFARRELPEGSEAGEALALGATATKRAAELTHQLLAYSGRGRFELARLELAQVVQENAALLRSSIPRSVALELAGEPCFVEADRAQLQQVVMNLLVNAGEAIGEAPGRVRLSTGLRVATAELLAGNRLQNRPAPGNYAFVEVQDDGCGMDEATLERLFDPFFTTKFTGRGLGMAAMHGIVTNHAGALLVKTAPGRGTTMTLLLPAVAPPAERPAQALPTRPERADGAARGELLVVDDERIVSLALCRQLRRLGWGSCVAQDGLEALQRFQERPSAFRAAILDLTMPKLTGIQLAAKLRELAPRLPIVLTSGYDLEPVEAEARCVYDAFLPKPYAVDELEAALEKALRASVAPPQL